MSKKISFNSNLRYLLTSIIRKTLIELRVYTESEKTAVLNICISNATSLNNALIKDLLDPNIFKELLVYTQDLVYASNLRTEENHRLNLVIDSVLQHIKKSFISKLKSDGIAYELSIYSNKASVLLTASEFLEQYKLSRLVNLITDICFYLSLYVSTYLVSFKNKPLYRFYEKDNHVQATYNSYTFEQLNSQQVIDAKLLYKLFINGYQDAYSNFMLRDIPTEFRAGFTSNLFLADTDIAPPFMNDFVTYTDGDSCIPLFEERKYATPNKGVLFTFKDKNKLIEKILMKEDSTQLLFKVYFKYVDNLLLIDSTVSNENLANKQKRDELIKQGVIKHVPKKDFILNLQADKLTLKTCSTIHDQLMSVNLVNTLIHDDTLCSTFAYLLNFIVIYCAYIAYTDPYKYKNILQISRGSTHGSVHSGHYSPGFVRKLPKGQKASAQALQNAKEADCFVPEGYTYVQEFNKHLRKVKNFSIF